MPASFIRLAAGALACALAWPASAQLLNEKNLSAAMAMRIAETALETCTKQGYHVSVHVLGRNGEVLVAVRGDGAPPHTMENSQRKAYTSRTFRIPSGEFVQRVKDNPTTGAVHLSGIIAAQGALPIKVGGRGHRRSRRVRGARWRKGRGLLQGRHRQGCRSAQVTDHGHWISSAVSSSGMLSIG